MRIIELDPKTNILAFVSFILSVIAIMHQLLGYFGGPDVRLHAPSSIVLKASNDGNLQVVAYPLGLSNRATSEYSEVILRIQAIIPVSRERSTTLDRHAFETGGEIESADQGMYTKNTGVTATPQVIPGRSALGFTVWFVPYPPPCIQPNCDLRKNYIKYDQALLEWILQQDITVKFQATTLIGKTSKLESACRFNGQNLSEYDRKFFLSEGVKNKFLTLACEQV